MDREDPDDNDVDRVRQAEQIVRIEDKPSGLVAWIVVDRVRSGLVAGGIRRARYADGDAAIAEARKLASRMSLKLAAADLPAGGAKTVILDHDELDVPGAYRALGRRIDELGVAYLCGPDIGTGTQELAYVREETDRVNPGANRPAVRTAEGVEQGIRATLEVMDDPAGIEGSRILVQGYGAVGRSLAARLASAGAIVRVAEVAPAARSRARSEGFELVPAESFPDQACTVFSPCAVSGVITEDTARGIPARAICGSANAPLASRKAVRILHDRGIAYAPDVLVNVGAVAEGVLTWKHGRQPAILGRVDEVIAGIRDRVRDVLETSVQEDTPPDEIVERRWGKP